MTLLERKTEGWRALRQWWAGDHTLAGLLGFSYPPLLSIQAHPVMTLKDRIDLDHSIPLPNVALNKSFLLFTVSLAL